MLRSIASRAGGSTLKTFLKGVLSWVRYPGIAVGLHTDIRGLNGDLGQVSLGSGVTILDSTFHGNTTIGRDCYLEGAELRGNNSIGASGYLKRVEMAFQSVLYERVRVFDTMVGSFSYVASESLLFRAAIGRFCSIGPRAILGHGEHPSHLISTHPVFFSTHKQCGVSFAKDPIDFDEMKDIVIGNDVWIGGGAYIKNGVVIGDGAVVGAGAVVTKNVEPYAIVAGVPARVIRYRFSESDIDRIRALEWWNLEPQLLEQGAEILASQDIARLERFVADHRA